MRLISMTDFVLKQRNNKDTDNIRRFLACERYAKFLKQLLELWMFMPCKLVDGIWAVMKTPDEKEEWFRNTYDNGWWGDFIEYKKEYQQAKERCLFEFNEGFLLFDGLDLENNTIEDLLNDDFEYTLTATAQKQIGA